MTEQEKEHKLTQTIEDLEDLTIDCTCLGITNDECDKCFRRKIAKYVFEREEAARKEIMKDVMSYLHELSGDNMMPAAKAGVDYVERMFCKKFGVEVEL